MLRHACGYKLANEGHDTRAIQHYLGHKVDVDKNFKRYFATTAARQCVSRVSSLSPN
jgi:site-specific recombinase XerD